MLLAKSQAAIAIKCRSAITMADEEPASGKDLFKPLKKADNCVIICQKGRITAIGSGKSPILPANCQCIDLGDNCIIPAVVNAHCHLQLSWLQNQLQWGNGFGPWLKSLIAKLLIKLNSGLQDFRTDQTLHSALVQAVQTLAASGTGLVGDIGASIPGSLTAVMEVCKKYGLQSLNFCEWFGFNDAWLTPWPPRCLDEFKRLKISEMDQCAPCAHALYSTGPEIFAQSKKHCNKTKKIFTFHLAESEAETELLCSGKGEIHELYANTVLPESWRPPGIRPFAYANKLGLIDSNTLAVHAVQLTEVEISGLAQQGAKVCLCPRSNANIGTGRANIRAMLQNRIMLCLGTDGLTSNTDLNIFNEAIFLLDQLPKEALLRMLTVNGAYCLRQDTANFQLRPGSPAQFAILPQELR